MMHFFGFKSKAALKAEVKARTNSERGPIDATHHFEETSFFGPEYKPDTVATYCVCMDHPKRSKFANITVDRDGYITKVA